MGRRASLRRACSVSATAAVSGGSQLAGSSSVPISIRSSRSMLLLRVGLADRDGQLPDAEDVGRALGDADAPARVEQVEEVRTLQRELERRQQQPGLEHLLAEGERVVEELAVVARVFLLRDAGVLV